MIILWMLKNVHIVSKLWIIDICNSKSQEKEEMLFARDDFILFWIIVIVRGFVMSFINFLN